MPWKRLAVALALSLWLTRLAPSAPEPTWLLTDLTLLTERGQLQPNQQILIRGVQIAQVGSDVPVAPEVPRICGHGATALPGLIDAHVHLGLMNPEDVVRGGVTTVRDLGWNPERIQELRHRLQTHPGRGPALLAVGPMLTCPGGYPSTAMWCPPGTALVVTPGQGAQAVARACTTATDGWLKVCLEPGAGPTLPDEDLNDLVAAAHQARLRVTAHVSGLPQLERVRRAGVDDLAHLLFDDSSIPQAMIERLVGSGVSACPTLHIHPSPVRLANLRAFHKAGGLVLYGTDMGNHGPPPGLDLEELQAMQACGMTPLEILAAATWKSADRLGLRDRGRLRPGLRADLILVDGDPTRDLSALTRLRLVVHAGYALKPR